MHIIVVSKADPARIHTLRLLNKHKIKHQVVVHTDAAKNVLTREALPHSQIVVSNTKKLVEKRNWILKHLVSPGEWYIGMDDNIQGFTRVQAPFLGNEVNDVTGKPPKGFKSWRQVYNHEVTPKQWLQTFESDIKRAEKIGAPYVGVATLENPYFRAKRFSNYRFVKTKVYALRNHKELFFKPDMGHDSYMSARAVTYFGKVLVDSYLHHKTRMYEGGGLGTREHREELGLLRFLDMTIKEFPGLVVLGKGQNTALKFRLCRPGPVERWRQAYFEGCSGYEVPVVPPALQE